MINKHKSNKIKENSNTVRHLNNGTDHRHSKSCCDQSSPARRTITQICLPPNMAGHFHVTPDVMWQLYIYCYIKTKNNKNCINKIYWSKQNTKLYQCDETSETSSPPLVRYPDSKVHGANMGPTWVLSAPDGPHVLAPWTLLSGMCCLLWVLGELLLEIESPLYLRK